LDYIVDIVDTNLNLCYDKYERYHTVTFLLVVNKILLLNKTRRIQNMKRLLPLLLLIAAIGIAGCAGIGNQGGGTQELACTGAGMTDGILITDFSFDFNQIYGGESVGLTLTVENEGGSTGTLQSYQLFGPDFGTGTMQWEITSGTATATSLGKSLSAPNPDLNIPGGMETVLWTIKAPSGLTVETPQNFNIRTTYEYSTVFSGILSVMSSSYLQSLPADQRKTLIQSGGLSASCYTGGPIQVEAAAGTHFVDPAGASKTIRFKVTNVGAGFPFYGLTSNYADITPATMYRVHVADQTSGPVTCTGIGDITLSRGQVGTFECTFTAATPSAKTDYNFQISLTYYYWQDSSAAIKVLRPL